MVEVLLCAVLCSWQLCVFCRLCVVRAVVSSSHGSSVEVDGGWGLCWIYRQRLSASLESAAVSAQRRSTRQRLHATRVHAPVRYTRSHATVTQLAIWLDDWPVNVCLQPAGSQSLSCWRCFRRSSLCASSGVKPAPRLNARSATPNSTGSSQSSPTN